MSSKELINYVSLNTFFNYNDCTTIVRALKYFTMPALNVLNIENEIE